MRSKAVQAFWAMHVVSIGFQNCTPNNKQQPDQGLATANLQFHGGVGIVSLAKPSLRHFGLNVARKSELLVTTEREEDVPRVDSVRAEAGSAACRLYRRRRRSPPRRSHPSNRHQATELLVPFTT
jgi:hypothetical protein